MVAPPATGKDTHMQIAEKAAATLLSLAAQFVILTAVIV
jgi:hypothetical protein